MNYIRICGAGGVFIAAYNLASAIFRGLGNSRAPLLFVAGTGVLVYLLGTAVRDRA